MASFATADAITTYDLSGTMNDGGDALTIAGTFNYDTSNNSVSNWDLAISAPPGGAPFCSPPNPCYTFEPGADASASFTQNTPDLFTFTQAASGFTNTLEIFVPGVSSSPLPDGAYTLDMTSELTTLSPDDVMGSAAFSSGALTAETPEPDTLPILLAATLLLGFVFLRRPRSKKEGPNSLGGAPSGRGKKS